MNFFSYLANFEPTKIIHGLVDLKHGLVDLKHGMEDRVKAYGVVELKHGW
jgi:hypothetical protein